MDFCEKNFVSKGVNIITILILALTGFIQACLIDLPKHKKPNQRIARVAHKDLTGPHIPESAGIVVSRRWVSEKFFSTKEVFIERSKLAPTSFNAREPFVEQKGDYLDVVLTLLCRSIYDLKQQYPNISNQELTTKLEDIKEEWLKRIQQMSSTNQKAKALEEAIKSIIFDFKSLTMDENGYLLPVRVNEEERGIRYSPTAKGEIKIQILTPEEYAEIKNQQRSVKERTPIPEEAVQPFRRAFSEWLETPEGKKATLEQKIRKLVELFVRSMQGLRGSPEEWVLKFVEALTPGNSPLHNKARESYRKLRKELADACGPQTLHSAIHNPKGASPLYKERYSSPAFNLSLNFAAALSIAIEMVLRDGELPLDQDGRVLLSAYTMAGLGGLEGVHIDPNNSFDLLSHLKRKYPEQPIIAHVKRDRERSHYIEVIHAGEEVVVRDNGEKSKVPREQFLKEWTGYVLVGKDMKNELENLAEQQKEGWWRNLNFKTLSLEELKKIKGSCGVISTRGIGPARELSSMGLLEYRGRDNVGIALTGPYGVDVVKVQGSSEELAREIYLNGQGFIPDELFYLPLPPEGEDDDLRAALIKLEEGKRLTYKDRLVLHRKWRSLSEKERGRIEAKVGEARDNVKERLNIAEVTILNFPIKELYPVILDPDGNVNKKISVGRGNAGSIWGGLWYPIPKDISGLVELVKELKRVYGLGEKYIKYFIKFELEEGIDAKRKDRLPQEELLAEKEEYMKDYDRLIDQIIGKKELSDEDQSRWLEISKFLNGRSVKIPGLFSPDPVRYLFRLQGALVGILRFRPEWKSEVEEIYKELLQQNKVKDGANRNWEVDWREEKRVNLAGLAFEALTHWFQQTFLPDDIIKKFGISMGRVDSITLGYMYWLDFVIGHDRWATTGSTRKKDAQPHTDIGCLSGLTPENWDKYVLPNSPSKQREARHRMREFIKIAKEYVPDDEKGTPTRIVAHNGDLNPKIVNAVRNSLIVLGYDFGGVGTDTKALVGLWEYISNAASLDLREGRISPDTNKYRKPDDPNNLLQGEVEIDGSRIPYTKLWNMIVDNYGKRKEQIPRDEIALRVALCIFAPESEIALDTHSLHMPNRHIAVSHNRPLYIVIVGDNYQVTSDKSSALSLFNQEDVEEDVADIEEIDEKVSREVGKAIKAMQEKISNIQTNDQIAEEERDRQIADAKEEFDGKVKEIVKDAESKKERIREKYRARVITLHGQELVACISKEFKDGKFNVRVDYTDFEGNPRDPRTTEGIEEDPEGLIPIDLATKGPFRTFAEEHIDEIPLIILTSSSTYITPENTVDMAMKRKDGQIQRYGVDIKRLTGKFGRDLSKLKRIIITGVGSSERDARCVERLFKTLLPGVEIVAIGPGELISTNMNLDPEGDLIIGISWSGTTALTLTALQIADSKGIAIISLTGNPDKEIGALTLKSMGVIQVMTGQEVAIFTTKGFLGILYDLGILAVQLSQLYKGNLTQEVLQKVESEREVIIQALKEMPVILRNVINSEQLDLEKGDSWVNKEGQRFRKCNGAIVIGSKHNNPIIEEGELKLEEVRWVVGKAYDYGDDTIWNLIKRDWSDEEKKVVIVSATDPERLKEAFNTIHRLNKLGIEFIVLTFEDRNEYYENIRKLCQNSEGRVSLFEVPRVHPALQGLVEAPFYFKFAVALARAAGLSDLEIDSSRNLAKSVTVKGIEVPGAVFGMAEYGLKRAGIDAKQSAEAYKAEIAGSWDDLQTAHAKAIARLPLVLYDVIERCFPSGGDIYGIPPPGRRSFHSDRVKVDKIRRIVVLTEEPAAYIAAAMSKGPLGYKERQATGKDIFPKYDKNGEIKEQGKGTIIPLNGVNYQVKFDPDIGIFTITNCRTNGSIQIHAQREETQEGVNWGVDEEQFKVSKNQINNFFGREYKITANNVEGLIFEAEKPTLAGVNVVVHRLTDYDLLSDIDENTMVVVLRRSNNRRENNAEIKPIADAEAGRNQEQKALPKDAKDEREMVEVLERIKSNHPDVPIYTITDPNSKAIISFGDAGNIFLPEDLDETSVIGAMYLSLLSLGVYIGREKEVPNIKYYQQALAASVDLAKEVVSDKNQRERIGNFFNALSQQMTGYGTMHSIGGGQDGWSAEAMAHIFERLCGVEDEALPVDECVHGPLAAVNNQESKFSNEDEKSGYNYEFNPNPQDESRLKDKDTLVFILATDSRTLKASIVDAQRYYTRSARFVLIVKESDKDKEEVKKSGASLILTIPDSPNELTNLSLIALAHILAAEYNRSKSDKFTHIPKAAYRLTSEVRRTLAELGFDEALGKEVALKSMRYEEGQIKARRSFLHLLAVLKSVSVAEILRWMLFHEAIHRNIDLLHEKQKRSLFDSLKPIITLDFWERFEDEFGPFEDDYDFLEEVIAQFYSARFENRKSLLFEGVDRQIEETLEKNEHFSTLHQLFTINISEDDSDEDVREKQIEKLKEICKFTGLAIQDPLNIVFESTDEEIERIVAIARMRARPSEFVTGPDYSQLMDENAVKISKRKIEQLESQGVEIVGDPDTMFIGEDVIIKDWRGGEIHPGTIITGDSYIGPGAVIEGTVHNSCVREGGRVIEGGEAIDSIVEPHAKVRGAYVRNATVRREAEVDTAGVETTDDFDPKDPKRWAYDELHRVSEHRAEIGKGSVVNNLAIVINSSVGEETEISGGSFNASEIGPYNKLRNVKADRLRTASYVRVRPEYPDDSPGPTEMQECWLGTGYGYDGLGQDEGNPLEGYREGPWFDMIVDPDEPEKPYFVAIGPTGEAYASWSSFYGTGEKSELVVSVDDRPIKSSHHMMLSAHPFAGIRSGTNLVGLPKKSSPLDFNQVSSATSVYPLAIAGALHGNELPGKPTHTWGPILGLKHKQNWGADHLPYLEYKAPNVIAYRIMNALAVHNNREMREVIVESIRRRKEALREQNIPEDILAMLEYRDDLERLMPAILRGKIKRLEALLEKAQNGEIRVSEEVMKRWQDAIRFYERHIESGLWKIEMVNGKLELVNWKWDPEQEEPILINPGQFEQNVEDGVALIAPHKEWPSHDFYTKVDDVFPQNHMPWYNPQILSEEALEDTRVTEGRVTPKKVNDLRERLKGYSNVVIDPYSVIGSDVRIEDGTPERYTQIKGGTVLNHSTVHPDAKIFRCYADGATFGNNGKYDFVEATSGANGQIKFGANTEYRVSRFQAEGGHTITVGNVSRGDHVTVVAKKRDVSIGENTTLFPYAKVVDSNIGSNSKIGCYVKDSNLGTGVTAQHVGIRIFNTDAPDTDVPNASNIAQGAIVGKPGGERVTLYPGVFVGTHTEVGEGSEIGELSFLVGNVPPYTVLPPFTLIDRDGQAIRLGVFKNRWLGDSFIFRFGFGYHLRYAKDEDQRRAVYLWIERLLLQMARRIWSDIDQKKGLPQELSSQLSTVNMHLEELLTFIESDLDGSEAVQKLSLQERIQERRKLSDNVRTSIVKAKKLSSGISGLEEDFDDLLLVCERLGDGRYRMRDGVFTDVMWVDGATQPQSLHILDAMKNRFAKTFIEGLKEKAQASQKDKKILIGFGTSWIPSGYNSGYDVAMQDLYRMLREEINDILSKSGINPDTIVWVHDRGGNLSDEVQSALNKSENKGKIDPHNILLVDEKGLADKLQENFPESFVLAVDPSGVQQRAGSNEAGYSYLVEILTLGTNLAFGGAAERAKELYFAITGKPLSDEGLKEALESRKLIILPRPNQVDYKSLINIYNGIREALRSA